MDAVTKYILYLFKEKHLIERKTNRTIFSPTRKIFLMEKITLNLVLSKFLSLSLSLLIFTYCLQLIHFSRRFKQPETRYRGQEVGWQEILSFRHSIAFQIARGSNSTRDWMGSIRYTGRIEREVEEGERWGATEGNTGIHSAPFPFGG